MAARRHGAKNSMGWRRMRSEPLAALERADEYVQAIAPLLDAATGIQHIAVFLNPDPKVVHAEPSIWPALRAAYVLSLLERSHLACVVTLARNHRWLSGVLSSVDTNNLLAFAACLRGFLEAAADSHDVLQYLPRALIEGRDYFYAALHRPERVQAELSCGPLEDRLIHFAFARRQEKGADAPSTHAPKTTTEYIRQIQSFGVDGAVALYAELCELTHPAAPSVDCFLDATTCNYVLNFHKDQDCIKELLRRHNGALIRLLMYSFNPALAGLAFLARLAPGWPAPSDRSLRDIPLATRSMPLFDALPIRFGEATPVASFQQALSQLAQAPSSAP
ncbi:MAG: hypothetical protein GX856_00740 [Gammaproteobacteria bacterium]|nr:hypothetical protein [Gammaproteobacteria bacterium]